MSRLPTVDETPVETLLGVSGSFVRFSCSVYSPVGCNGLTVTMFCAWVQVRGVTTENSLLSTCGNHPSRSAIGSLRRVIGLADCVAGSCELLA